jgi:hypothetical protein
MLVLASSAAAFFAQLRERVLSGRRLSVFIAARKCLVLKQT